jgi:HAD superfamily hydrolase (TIGR01509 family)
VIELVIFDCDGVLVDSEPIANRVLAEELTLAGLPTTTEQSMRQYMGRRTEDWLPIAEQQLGRPLGGEFVARLRARTIQAFRGELRAVPGVGAALARIRVPVCVASSSAPERLRVALEVTGLAGRFLGRVFSAEEVERGKPFPDLFLFAARRMGVAPEACAVVEDTERGVQAALAAGMAAFGYAAASDAEGLARAGARVFREMVELPTLLDGAAR